MPTVILLDVSLSMSRPVPAEEGLEELTRRSLAINGINALLDYCAQNSKLEFISLIVFSSLYEQLVNFTRDYESIRTALESVEDYDKTCLEPALAGVNSLVTNEWGVSTHTEIIIITDGSTGVGNSSLHSSLQHHQLHKSSDGRTSKFPLPFSFPYRLHIVCLAPNDDGHLVASMNSLQQLIDIGLKASDGPFQGDIYIPDGALSSKSVMAVFKKLAEKTYKPFLGVLQCGNLKCNVQVFPTPQVYNKAHDYQDVNKAMDETIQICGFLDIGDITSPPTISKHLILPIGGKDNSDAVDADHDEGKVAAVTVLLHGSLKVQNMVAVAQVGEDWYGLLYSWADSKKKANLMLSLFKPGDGSVSWLGSLRQLGPISGFVEPPYGEDDKQSPFPVRPAERRSYAQNCVIWVKATGLQADIQKILRHARKLPEKQVNFYKELNRLRKAALSFGFIELLDAVSAMLERECTQLPGTAHPDAALQLTHAATALRSENARDISHNVVPLRTNFSSD